jgi:succinate dehydrogenase / fumarate reductase cytochrome b subunit
MVRRLDMVLSSIGKKELMALSGLGFIGFLVAHLAGNFTILSGAEALDGYVAKLEALGPLVWVAEAGMVTMALVHVLVGITLVVRNLQARGQRYAMKKSEGGRTIGSRTMWLTGPWILVFVGIHLAQFTFPHKLTEEAPALSKLVAEQLSDPIWAGYYVVTMLILALHVSHGFWSAFQTLGAAPSRSGYLRDTAVLLAFVFGAGFSLLAFMVFNVPDLLK